MPDDVIARLREAGVPNLAEPSAVTGLLICSPHDCELYRVQVATDLDRIGRVWLERRLAAISQGGAAVAVPSSYQTYGDGARVHVAVTPADLLSLLCPEVPRG